MTIGEFIEHFDMFNDKVGIQILPSNRAKYILLLVIIKIA